jgi:hypothetical protein
LRCDVRIRLTRQIELAMMLEALQQTEWFANLPEFHIGTCHPQVLKSIFSSIPSGSRPLMSLATNGFFFAALLS